MNPSTRETLIAWATTNGLLLLALALLARDWRAAAIFGACNLIVSAGVAAFCADAIGRRWGVAYRRHAVQSVSALLCLVPALIASVAIAISPPMRADYEQILASAWVVPLATAVALYLSAWLILALVEVSQRGEEQTA